MEIILLISAFINFIVLIMFFQLVRDTEIIRRTFFNSNPTYWLDQYNKASYLNRDKDALRFLQEYIWASVKKDKSAKRYESLRSQHEKRIIELGSKFPKHPFY